MRVHLVQAGAIPIVFQHLNGSFPNHLFARKKSNAGGSAEQRQAAAKAAREQIKAEKLILRR